MKKTLATLLSASMLLSVVPAIGSSVSAAEPERVEGLTMTSYTFVAHQPQWSPAYAHLMGQKAMGYQCYFDDTTKMFDRTIDDLLEWSEVMGSEDATGFGNPDDILVRHSTKDDGNYRDNYLIKWEGKVTAANDVKFTVVGNKIDNGFIMFIDGERVYEYWGTGYFDGNDDKLPSDYGQVSLKKGEHKIEAWFLEIDGNAPLDMGVYLDGSTEYKGFGDAGLTFAMTATAYHTIIDRWGEDNNEDHAWVKAFADIGHKKGNNGNGGNGAQCTPDNQWYDETIDAMLAASKKIGSIVVPRVDTLTLSVTDESYLNMYEGFVSVDQTGWYLFGCQKVDNAFMMEIDGQRVFEIWANGTWNDVDPWSWMPESSAIYLEAGETYTFKAAFAEFNGGQALWPRVAISDNKDSFNKDAWKEMNETLNYTTVPPTDNDRVADSVLNAADAVWLNDKVDLDSIGHDMGDDVWGDSPVKDIFDNNKDTKMGAHRKWGGVTVTWATTEPTTVTHYQIRTSNVTKLFDSVPVAWVLLGSNDEGEVKTYTIIDKVSRGRAGIGAEDFSEGVFAVDEPTAYKYYKLQLVNTWNGNGGEPYDEDVAVSIADLNLYNIPSAVVTPPSTGEEEVEYVYEEIDFDLGNLSEDGENAAQSGKMGSVVYWVDHNWNDSDVTVTKAEIVGNTINFGFTHTGTNGFGAQIFYNPKGTVNGTTFKVELTITSDVDAVISVSGEPYTIKAGVPTKISYIVTADMDPEPEIPYEYGTSVVEIQFGVGQFKDGTEHDIVDGNYSITIDSIAVQTEKAPSGSGDKDKDTKPAPTGSASIAIAAVAVISLAGVVVATKKREQD